MDTSATRQSGSLATGQWAIVPRSSTAGFAVRNFGLNTVRGIVPIRSATVVCDGDGTGGRVTAVHAELDLAGINTANTRRDKDLRGSRLLDTDRYPRLTFDCTEVRTTADGWRLAGTLSAHGTSTAVTVDAVRHAGPVNGLLTVRATTSFDRQELGITAPRVLIGHRVAVEVEAQFRVG
ncbi:YceI family protein [Nakamurella sp. GG22]